MLIEKHLSTIMKKDRDIEYYKSSYESSREKLVLNRKAHNEEINKLKKLVETIDKEREIQVLQLKEEINALK